ncbi:VanZ family protein [Pedococcus sp. KACC 23699]|uniref:VanZ family protein n=1 Tax=Pedococcus sp. KACC 23699 TaxID=3149228 RepID=A0AAU7JVH3_9MICO
MNRFWGYRIPLLVVPVVLTYAVLAVWWVWRGRTHLTVTLERVLLGGAVVFATVVTMSPPGVGDTGVLQSDRSCAIHAVDLGLGAITADDQRILNMLLLLPVGLFAAVVSARLSAGRALAVVAGCAVLPVLFEGGQQAFPGLQRTCDTTDLADNLSGFVLGLVLGAAVMGLRWAVSRNAGRVAS